MANNSFNPYEVLSSAGTKVNKDSSAEQIKKSYRKAAMTYHPDKQGGKSDEEKKAAEEKFKDIQKAYDILSDTDKKQKYDMFGIIDGDASSQQSGNPFGGFGGFGGFDPFDDIRNMFGGRGSRQQYVQPGQDIKMRIPLSIKDIYCGCTKTVKFTRNVRCQNCHGSGAHNNKIKTCPHCNGTGTIVDIQRNGYSIIQQQRPCPHCNGTGKIIEEKCHTCHGTGFRQEETQQTITFPAGIREGQGMKIDNAGSESKTIGGQNGNFIAMAVWNIDNNRYSIEGADIIEHININYEDCILGTKYQIVLPDDTKVDVSIPKLTPPGRKLKLNGRGIKMTDAWGRSVVGNYIIDVNYILPTDLDYEETNALKDIHDIHAGIKLPEETDIDFEVEEEGELH